MRLKVLVFGILGYIGAVLGWNAWATINSYPHWLIYVVEFAMLGAYIFACVRKEQENDD